MDLCTIAFLLNTKNWSLISIPSVYYYLDHTFHSLVGAIEVALTCTEVERTSTTEHDYRFVAYKVCVLLYARVQSAIMRYLMTKTTVYNICVYMCFHTKGGYSYLNFSSVELNPTV